MACIFCSIATKQIPADILYETDQVFVVKDIHPKTKVHLLVIPKVHIETLHQLTSAQANVLVDIVAAITAVTKAQGIADSGYKVVSNNGPDSGQEVPHLHFHVLGGQRLAGLV